MAGCVYKNYTAVRITNVVVAGLAALVKNDAIVLSQTLYGAFLERDIGECCGNVRVKMQ
jgi:hypothetical protein